MYKYKSEADETETKLYNAQVELRKTRAEYEKNNAYHILEQKKNELQDVMTKNAELKDKMETNDFIG